MAKLDLALIVRTVDKATAPLRRIQQSVRQVGRSTGLDRVGRNLRLVGRQLGNVGREAGAFGRRFGLVMAGAGGATFLFAKKYAESADDIAKLAKRSGFGVEEIQKLRHAFELGGSEIGRTDRSLEYFARSVGEAAKGTGEAAEIFRAMGIDVRDTNGAMRPLGDILNDVADAMAAQEDPAKKAFAAQRMFGRSGTALIPTLNEGADGMRAQGEAATALGLVTEDEAKRAEKYVDEQTRLKDAVKGVGNAIGAFLIPGLTDATVKMREWMVENRPEIVEEVAKALRNFNAAIDWFGRHLGFANEKLNAFRDWVRETFPAVGEAIDKFTKWADEIGWLTVALGAVTFLLGRTLIGAILRLAWPLVGLTFAIGRVAFGLAFLAGKVALGLGRLLVAGSHAPARIRSSCVRCGRARAGGSRPKGRRGPRPPRSRGRDASDRCGTADLRRGGPGAGSARPGGRGWPRATRDRRSHAPDRSGAEDIRCGRARARSAWAGGRVGARTARSGGGASPDRRGAAGLRRGRARSRGARPSGRGGSWSSRDRRGHASDRRGSPCVRRGG